MLVYAEWRVEWRMVAHMLCCFAFVLLVLSNAKRRGVKITNEIIFIEIHAMSLHSNLMGLTFI